MKKLTLGFSLAAIIGSVMMAFVVFNQDKTYKVELPLPTWDKHVSGLNSIQNVLENSTLPANQVKFMRDSIITPLLLDIINQVRPQLPKDTIKQK